MANIKDRIPGRNGWAEIAYSNLYSSVTGLIKAGMNKESAIKTAFKASCAGESIKKRIEAKIMCEF